MENQESNIRPCENNGTLYWLITEGDLLHPHIIERLDEMFNIRSAISVFLETLTEDLILYTSPDWSIDDRKDASIAMSFMSRVLSFVSEDYANYNEKRKGDRAAISWKFYRLIESYGPGNYEAVNLMEGIAKVVSVSTNVKPFIEKQKPWDYLNENLEMLRPYSMFERLVFDCAYILKKEEESNKSTSKPATNVKGNSGDLSNTVHARVRNLEKGKYCITCKDGKTVFFSFESFNEVTGNVMGTKSSGQAFSINANDITEIYHIQPVNAFA